MSFFKKYSGTANIQLVRLERLIWALIYGGLLGVVLGGFMLHRGADGADWWIAGGLLVCAVGVALIFLRARLREGA